MSDNTGTDCETPQALDDNFKKAAKASSSAAAKEKLARGMAVTYRDGSTPPGCVMRKYPDGRIEVIKVDMDEGMSLEP